MVALKKLRRRVMSLSGRLVAGVSLIHFVMSPLLLGGVLYITGQTIKDQFINDTRNTAGLIATAMSSLQHHPDHAHLVNFIDEIIISNDVVFAELLLPDGKRLSSDLPLAIKNVVFHEDIDFASNGDNIYFIELPIRIEGMDAPAALRLGFNEQHTHDKLTIISRYLVAITVCYILVSLLLVYYLGAGLTRPLARLRHAARKIRHGRLGTELDVNTSITEINDLATDLDAMREELVSQTRKLEHQALHDALTGLPNRALLDDRLTQATLSINRSPQPFALLLMDLDRFKEVNDTLGHHAGDEVLRQAASRLRHAVREKDTVARLGGDEFAIILYGVTDQAAGITENIVRAIQQAFIVHEQPLHIGISVGIAHFPRHSKDTETLVRLADIAMYEAKNRGIDYQTYHQSQDRIDTEGLTLTSQLKHAVTTQQIILHYQPKIDLQTGELLEFEALARWEHPEKGLLPPSKFIHLAENTGNIGDLTRQLLKTAVSDAVNWKQAGRLMKIAVNLSPTNLLDDDLPGYLHALLHEAELPAEYIGLEITENAIIQDPEHTANNLHRLRDMDFRIIIDDFGTGYSSLVHLRHLPVDEIKIDRHFITDIIHNSDDQHIVKAIIGMAHDLDLSITAEGIENAVTGNYLKSLGCDKGQGYHYSRPLPVSDLNKWQAYYNRSRVHGVG